MSNVSSSKTKKKNSKIAIYISSSSSDSDISDATSIQQSNSRSSNRNHINSLSSSNHSTSYYDYTSAPSSRRSMLSGDEIDEIDSDELEENGLIIDENQAKKNQKIISRKLHEQNKKSFNKLDLVPLTLKVVPANREPYDPNIIHNQPLIQSPGSKLITKEIQELQKDLDNLQQELDDDSDDDNLFLNKKFDNQKETNQNHETNFEINQNTPTNDLSNENVKRIILMHKESNHLWNFNWTPNVSFYNLIRKTVPKPIREGNIKLIIDDKEWNMDELSYDIVHNDEYIYLISDPTIKKDDVERKKLVLSFSDGTRKKITIAINKKWGDILNHFGDNWTRLIFDGEELDPNEMISVNKDISNDDQIDVE